MLAKTRARSAAGISSSRPNAPGVATSSRRWFPQRPPASRKVLMPLSAETPAPVRTVIPPRRASRATSSRVTIRPRSRLEPPEGESRDMVEVVVEGPELCSDLEGVGGDPDVVRGYRRAPALQVGRDPAVTVRRRPGHILHGHVGVPE